MTTTHVVSLPTTAVVERCAQRDFLRGVQNLFRAAPDGRHGRRQRRSSSRRLKKTLDTLVRRAFYVTKTRGMRERMRENEREDERERERDLPSPPLPHQN